MLENVASSGRVIQASVCAPRFFVSLRKSLEESLNICTSRWKARDLVSLMSNTVLPRRCALINQILIFCSVMNDSCGKHSGAKFGPATQHICPTTSQLCHSESTMYRHLMWTTMVCLQNFMWCRMHLRRCFAALRRRLSHALALFHFVTSLATCIHVSQ